MCDFVTFNYIKQQIVDGFFHADPHPGNMFFLPNNKMCYIDFGLMGNLSPSLQQMAINWLQAIIAQDPKGVVTTLLKLKKDSDTVERDELMEVVKSLMDKLKKSTQSEYSLSRMCYDILVAAIDFKIVVPRALLLFVRGISVLDGAATRLSPDFHYVDSAQRAFWRVLLMRSAMNKKNPEVSLMAEHLTEYAQSISKVLNSYPLEHMLMKGGEGNG
jgi:ubiquinone biosynthesis protein